MTALRGLALAIAVVVSACSVEQPGVVTQNIIDGDLSDPSEFPATGMLVIQDRLVCTATLIAPDVAITAAHCLTPPAFGTFGFTLDTDQSDGTDHVIPVTIYHAHPGFDDGVDDFVDLAERSDIGVVLLAEPVLDVVPEQIEQPSDDMQLDPGGQLSLCGYGRVVWHTGTLAVKRDAEVIVDRSETFEFSTTVAGPQPCNGDSGGPLFAETPKGRRMVGVVSRALGRSVMCDTGAIITRIRPYADWIYLASHDHNTGGCNAGGGGAALPFGLWWLAAAVRRRRRAAR